MLLTKVTYQAPSMLCVCVFMESWNACCPFKWLGWNCCITNVIMTLAGWKFNLVHVISLPPSHGTKSHHVLNFKVVFGEHKKSAFHFCLFFLYKDSLFFTIWQPAITIKTVSWQIKWGNRQRDCSEMSQYRSKVKLFSYRDWFTVKTDIHTPLHIHL